MRLVLLLSLILSFRAVAIAAPDAGARVSFNRDIRPIFSDICYNCHGPDKNTRKAKLRLDTAEGALAEKDGVRAVVPGKPGESEMVKRILTTDPDDVMPPPKSGKHLTPEQIQLLQRWVEQGAEYEGHWAYAKPKSTKIPTVTNPAWPWNPIDSFVLARLEQEHLRPAAEADRRTLIRRVSFDLTGLPPRPEMVESFVRSKDPRAYDRLVDALLASKSYGERMAVQWLDLVRYADTIGFHGDNTYSVWPYRDYVISAFNRNLPFDQFTREQIAGDLIPGATREQKVASGYNRLNKISGEGGVQDKEYRAKYASDRVRTTTAVWMGATMGCAECHDHKFDPYSTKDFYRFAAFFSDLKEKGFYDDGFLKNDWGPKLSLPTPTQEKRLAQLDAQIAALTNQAVLSEETSAAGQRQWESAIRGAMKANALEWKNLPPLLLTSIGGATFRTNGDHSVLVEGLNPKHDTYVVEIPATNEIITAVRLETLKDDVLQGNSLARSGITFVLAEVDVDYIDDKGRSRKVKVDRALADHSQFGFPVAALIDGKADTAWAISGGHSMDRKAVLILSEALKGSSGGRLRVTLRHSDKHPEQHVGKFRLSVTSFTYPFHHKFNMPDDVMKAAVVLEGARSPEQKKLVDQFYRNVDPEAVRRQALLGPLVLERDVLVGRIPSMLVSEATEPRPMRVLARGNWMDDSGEVVEPGVPHFMRQVAEGRRATRLDLADWLVSRDNPATARVFVNRLWKLCFGTGLSKTLDDFGAQGEWPTHPELLDWLATEFMESGWDTKHMLRLIVTSRTYRQSSMSNPLLEEKDPFNRLLARQSRLRLAAEMVRDNALAASDLLVGKVGGPSVHPYQPEGYFAALNFPKREYVADEGDNLYRRGVYTHWQRTFLHPSLLAFDAPSREECTANRVNSNTPLQALVLLNDPIYVEASRVFAENVMRRGGRSFDSRLAWAFGKALSRPPKPTEKALLGELYQRQLARYRSDRSEASKLVATGEARVANDLNPAELAAWSGVTRALLNTHEIITRN